jgi:urocanate hydratase
MHRFEPRNVARRSGDERRQEYSYAMKAHPIGAYPAKCQQAAALMHMIQNNLDPAVAQFPAELVTYGGNGSAFSNWAQVT